MKKFFSNIRFATLIYPIFIVICIPLLLVINTLWNLKSFNRDANFIVRHQATSLAEAVLPQINDALLVGNNISNIIKTIDERSEDIVSITVLEKDGAGFKVIESSVEAINPDLLSDVTLNNLSLSSGDSYAGLSYDPSLQKNIWKVSVPFPDSDTKILAVNLSTDHISSILERTSKDSLFLLSATLIIALALLINHLIFYKKSLRTEQLEEVNKLKDEFISVASHELRAPVTGVVGYLELLKDRLKGQMSDALDEDFKTLKVLTNNLNKLINDLLEVSRIEQGRLKVEITNVEPQSVLTDVVKEFVPTASQKGITLSNTPQKLPQIMSDPERLRQILNNLVSNAIKYSLKGKVQIETKISGKYIEFKVSDAGIGIPPTEMKNLFGKFHRVKDRQTESVNGTGLGLWITKQLVERLGGKIYVESIYGTGTTFTFTLPVNT